MNFAQNITLSSCVFHSNNIHVHVLLLHEFRYWAISMTISMLFFFYSYIENSSIGLCAKLFESQAQIWHNTTIQIVLFGGQASKWTVNQSKVPFEHINIQVNSWSIGHTIKLNKESSVTLYYAGSVTYTRQTIPPFKHQVFTSNIKRATL